jgi:LmbE family N-acetylglucosaminyl deacetylase
MSNILVVVAHSDDETIGMGGTIAKLASAGAKVSVMSLTDGVGARRFEDHQAQSNRAQNAERAATILNFSWVAQKLYPDNGLDSVPLLEIVQEIEDIKNELEPEIVFTHSPADLNVDHRRTFEAVLTAFRPEPGQSLRELRLFEIPSATDFSFPGFTKEFSPRIYEGVQSFWEKKLLALSAYGSEIKDYPHSRSLEAISALAVVRGAQVGMFKAEAFDIVRSLRP